MLDEQTLKNIAICPSAIAEISQPVAIAFGILPYSIDGSTLHLVLSSNPDKAIEFLQSFVPKEITFEIADYDMLLPIIKSHYSSVFSEIQNCDAKFSYRCPKQWIDLEVTEDPSVRYCKECSQEVYHCSTKEELDERTLAHQCVAFYDIQEEFLGLVAFDTDI